MTPRQRLNLLNAFDEAAQDYAWRGGMHPRHDAEITVEYRRLKRLLAKELGVELPEPVSAGDEFS